MEPDNSPNDQRVKAEVKRQAQWYRNTIVLYRKEVAIREAIIRKFDPAYIAKPG